MNLDAPSDLGDEGNALWNTLSTKYEYEDHERSILVHICRLEDEIARCRAALKSTPSLLSTGSMGQKVEHPLLGTVRNHLKLQTGLIKELYKEAQSADVSTAAGRALNKVRWDKQRGA